MSNEDGRHWTWLERTSNIISVVTFGPILAGLSVLGALLSQNVPFISAYGFFGAFIIGLASLLVLCVCVAILSSGARKRPEAQTGRKNTQAGWPWIIGSICVVA